MKTSSLLLLSIAIALPVAAHADVYQYSGTIGGPVAIFTFDHDGLILTPTTVTPISCAVTENPGDDPCNSITLTPFNGSYFDLGQGPVEEGTIEFDENGLNLFNDPIPPSTFFTTVGFNSYGTLDTLTITDLTTSATPEPSSLVLLGTGVLGMAGAIRRRFRKA